MSMFTSKVNVASVDNIGIQCINCQREGVCLTDRRQTKNNSLSALDSLGDVLRPRIKKRNVEKTLLICIIEVDCKNFEKHIRKQWGPAVLKIHGSE